MTAFLSTNGTVRLACATLTAALICLAAGGASTVEIRSGQASFEATTNMPGVEVKGKSNALTAHVEVVRNNDSLVLQQVSATVPVNSLATGMKVRDEHMRRYIFATPDGKEPDLQFTAQPITCAAGAAHEFTCPIAGTFSLRGAARPFTMQLRVKEQGPVYRASGDAVLKLSDYGIEPPSQFGVKPSNEVKFHIEFNAKPTVDVSSNLGGDR